MFNFWIKLGGIPGGNLFFYKEEYFLRRNLENLKSLLSNYNSKKRLAGKNPQAFLIILPPIL
jgi:hypothetical protein